MQLHALESLFKIFYTIACKDFPSYRLKFPGEKSQKNMWKI